MKSNILQKPEMIFIIFAFVFGLLMSILTPLGEVLDEDPHRYRAIQISNGILYNGRHNPEIVTDYHYNSAIGYSPVMYIFSSLGMKVSKLYYVPRFFNLLGWIFLIALAIRITPVFKWAFFLAALAPTSLFEGMSISADSFNNAFAFLYFAYVFKLIYGEKEFSYTKDLPILMILSVIGGLCKGIIVPAFLIPLIPMKKRKSIPLFLFILSLGLGTSLLWSSNNQVSVRPETSFDANRDFIIHHTFNYLNVFFNTVKECFIGWFHGAIIQLGNVHTDGIFTYLYMLMLFCNVCFISHKARIAKWHKVISFLALFIFTLMTCTLMYMIYTISNSNVVEGVQGRYFISVLPLLFVIFATNRNTYKYNDITVRMTVIFTFIMLCYACIMLNNCFLRLYL